MNGRHPFKRICSFVFAALMTLVVNQACGSGFALIEQSVSSMGNAYAGAGSAAEDTSYMFFNPASMSLLEGDQLSSGLHIVLPNTEFSGTGTITGGTPFDGMTITGGNGGDAGTTGLVPHFAYVRSINEKMNAGITVNAPFGLKTEYNDGWVGRYSALESEILSLNINPNISYRINDRASVGFGVSAMYAKLKLKNNVDAGLVLGFPGAADLLAQLDVDDWGFGYNYGVLLEPTDSTRIGFAYRSKVKVKMDGDVTITVVGTQGAKLDTDLPATALVSVYHEVGSKWAVMGDVMWTQWSNQDALVARFADGSSNTIPLDWKNTVRVAVGASYKYSNKLTLRTGLAFDESPISSADLRIAALPDDDRTWLTFGAGYKHSDKLSIDFGYAHLFIDDPSIDNEDAISSVSGGGFHNLKGQYDADANIISAQLNYKFH